MAVSKVSIINKALTLVGAEPIVNITDSSEQARVISRVYELALRGVLSECRWNFATKRVLLSLVTDTLDWYYSSENESYVYNKPADVIRIFSTNDEDATWREEGDYIISNTSGLGIKYVYYLDDATKFPIFFMDALIDRLASDVAYRIVNSRTLGEEYFEKYSKVSLPKALSQNSQIGTQQFIKDDAWELAKYSNSASNC